VTCIHRVCGCVVYPLGHTGHIACCSALN